MRAALAVIAASALLAACAGGSGGLRRTDGPGGVAGPASPFEVAQAQRAQEQVKDGQLAEAAWSWEVLTVLRPENATYRDSLAATRQLIDSGVAERGEKARAAQKRGDLDGATAGYLSVLALQPDNEAASEALRAIEKERNRKSYLGTPSRVTLRKGTPPAPKAPAKGTAAQPAPDRNELEHIAMLSAQGEIDEPIRLLEKRAPQDRNDPSAKRLLADLYVRKAEKLSATDRPAAIGWLQKCLRIDPKHARATALMRQWIDDTSAKGPLPVVPPGAGQAAPAKGKVEKR
jgi:tetratricopeptide (TPR) repeat protein